MLEALKEKVFRANIRLVEAGLVILTWGNASGIDRSKGLVVIKPSGVGYGELSPEKMVVVDLNGNVLEGKLRPSSDTPTHIVLYTERYGSVYLRKASAFPPEHFHSDRPPPSFRVTVRRIPPRWALLPRVPCCGQYHSHCPMSESLNRPRPAVYWP